MAGTVQDNNGRALVVSSCTFALEMAAIVADMQPGDEVIVPSYTYVTTVNAFALRGAVPVFVDVDDAMMNIDATLIERAITPKTRASIPSPLWRARMRHGQNHGGRQKTPAVRL